MEISTENNIFLNYHIFQKLSKIYKKYICYIHIHIYKKFIKQNCSAYFKKDFLFLQTISFTKLLYTYIVQILLIQFIYYFIHFISKSNQYQNISYFHFIFFPPVSKKYQKNLLQLKNFLKYKIDEIFSVFGLLVTFIILIIIILDY